MLVSLHIWDWLSPWLDCKETKKKTKCNDDLLSCGLLWGWSWVILLWLAKHNNLSCSTQKGEMKEDTRRMESERQQDHQQSQRTVMFFLQKLMVLLSWRVKKKTLPAEWNLLENLEVSNEEINPSFGTTINGFTGFINIVVLVTVSPQQNQVDENSEAGWSKHSAFTLYEKCDYNT